MGISTRSEAVPNAFVEITIHPESRVHSKCFSTIYEHSSKPVFDEKLSIELPLTFETKRFVYKVWHVRSQTRARELLGCTSFGLHRVLQGELVASGWCFILDENIGLTRHVMVIDATCVKKFTAHLNVSKVLLCRNEEGSFGFTVMGSCPVRICTVRKGSAAELHELQRGDAILGIDVFDARHFGTSEVAAIIRSLKSFTSMTPQRGPQNPSDRNEDKMRNGVVVKLIMMMYCRVDRGLSSASAQAANPPPTDSVSERRGWYRTTFASDCPESGSARGYQSCSRSASKLAPDTVQKVGPAESEVEGMSPIHSAMPAGLF